MIKIGEKYNLLTVINESPRRGKSGIKYWICKCDCGNIKEIRGDKIQSGHTKSCGCLNTVKRIVDISGKVYGMLTVLEPTDMRASGGYVIWKCQCECGNYAYATKSELVNNRKKSCGCINSHGEMIISKILTKNNILYKKQYTFSDLKDQNCLRFDFGILNTNNELQYLIEYDGDVHFGKSKTWNGHVDTEIVQKHDKMKNNYCLQNNIPLIRIPYTHLEFLCLEDLLLDTTSFLYIEDKKK